MRTNEQRAEAAAWALVAHAIIIGDEPDLRTRVVDLLADLRHFACEHDINFEDALVMSEFHFTEEACERSRLLLNR